MQRTDKPFVLSFTFRLTVAFAEFRFRFQALAPDSDEDQKFPFVPRLLKEPAFAYPARAPDASSLRYSSDMACLDILGDEGSPLYLAPKRTREDDGTHYALPFPLWRETALAMILYSVALFLPRVELFAYGFDLHVEKHELIQVDLMQVTEKPQEKPDHFDILPC